jgi:hypothetical protein
MPIVRFMFLMGQDRRRIKTEQTWLISLDWLHSRVKFAPPVAERWTDRNGQFLANDLALRGFARSSWRLRVLCLGPGTSVRDRLFRHRRAGEIIGRVGERGFLPTFVTRRASCLLCDSRHSRCPRSRAASSPGRGFGTAPPRAKTPPSPSIVRSMLGPKLELRLMTLLSTRRECHCRWRRFQ